MRHVVLPWTRRFIDLALVITIGGGGGGGGGEARVAGPTGDHDMIRSKTCVNAATIVITRARSMNRLVQGRTTWRIIFR